MDEQPEKGEWYVCCHLREVVNERKKLICYRGFKALKQMTKMNYLYRNQPDEALRTYKELLGYTKVSTEPSVQLVQLFYSLIIEVLLRDVADRISEQCH